MSLSRPGFELSCWEACIVNSDGKQVSLGFFSPSDSDSDDGHGISAEERAARTFDDAVREFGLRPALLNFPTDVERAMVDARDREAKPSLDPLHTAAHQLDVTSPRAALDLSNMSVRFCTHLDIDSYDTQKNELVRCMPQWLMCGSRYDVLRRMRRPVLGMTSPQMYVKVAGVWTAAHEENNRFRSINCSHGPGNNSWGAIDACHASRLRQLVQQHHDVDIYKSEATWLPDLAFLMQHGIPVMYGEQRPLDMVSIGCGCLHWVYSRGTSINSAWNFGDFSREQIQVCGAFQLAFAWSAANVPYPHYSTFTLFTHAHIPS